MDYEENGQKPNENAMPTADQIDNMSDDEVLELQAKLASESEMQPESADATDEQASSDGAAEQPQAAGDDVAQDDDPSDEGDDDAQAKKSDTVPHGRFHRENERQKAPKTNLSSFV